MREWIKSQLWEIQQSSTLRHLGALLALSHVLTYIQWSNSTSFLFQAKSQGGPLCWEALKSCADLNPFGPGGAKGLLIAYLVIALIALVVFFFEQLLALGWSLLLAAFVVQTSLYLLDASLAANIHVALFFLQLAYLFVPQKRRMTAALGVSAYLTMGLLKLDMDWLAGFWISARVDVLPAKGAEWFAALATLTELIAPFLLIVPQGPMFASGFAALAIYHVASWILIDFFEPAVFCVLLIFFLLNHFEVLRLARESLYQSYIRPEPSRAWIPAGLALFALLQAAPHFGWGGTWPEHPLRMVRATVPRSCEQFNFAVYRDETRELASDSSATTSEDLKCNASVRRQSAMSQCRALRGHKDFDHMSSFFRSRTVSATEFERVFELENACDPRDRATTQEARR